LLALVETGPGENIDCGPARREAPARLSSQVTADLALR
jgi:hypothetical protein